MDHLIGAYIDDKYRVIRKVGEGAMGIVYLAEAIEFDDAPVAIKVMRRSTDDPAAPERFLREAEALAALDCPQIVQLYGFDRDMTHHLLYVAMEYAEGDDLSDIIAAGRSSTEFVLEAIEQVCAGLTEAHGHGIFHRDLKPANLKVVPQRDGSILLKILDFGLVRVRGDRARLTDEGKAPGTLSYMSPEELREEELDGRIDIYSLGVIAYELLSGRPPFTGKVPLQTARNILTSEPEPLANLAAVLPDGVAELVTAMMRRDRDKRLQGPSQVCDMVDAIRRNANLDSFRVSHLGVSQNLRRDYGLFSSQ